MKNQENYKIKYEMHAKDVFGLSMSGIYSSMVGFCNVIITLSLIVLTVLFWNKTPLLGRLFLLVACMTFPLFQPLVIYRRAQNIVSHGIREFEMQVNNQGIQVVANGTSERIPWEHVANVLKKRRQVIVYVNRTHGYVIPNRALEGRKDAFFLYVQSKIKKE